MKIRKNPKKNRTRHAIPVVILSTVLLFTMSVFYIDSTSSSAAGTDHLFLPDSTVTNTASDDSTNEGSDNSTDEDGTTEYLVTTEYPDEPGKAPELASNYAIVLDANTGNILYQKNAFDKQYPASITKIMTFLLAIENTKLTDTVTMSHDAVFGIDRGSSHIGLDEGEQKLWKDSIMAGNLYINRGITGAIVNRQPFGGMKLSAFGGGVKAGGPNYCACFVNIADKPGSTTDYTQSYVKAYEQEFAHARDVNNLYGEQNAFRYLPLKNMVLRLFPGDNNEDAKMIALAARICHTPLSISFEPGDDRTAALASLGCPLKEEALAGFLKSMKNYERIRTCGADIPMEMYEEAARIDKYIATAKPVKDGRVELIHYIKEQSISFEYHRYGSILEVPSVE